MMVLKDVMISRGNHSCHVALLELEPGSALGLVGPNGSGKTTLMNALVMTPGIRVRGDVAIDGCSRSMRPEYLQKLFYSSGTTRDLFENLSVEETLAQTKRAWSSSIDIDGTINRFGMEAYRKKRVANLSQGMAQLLYLALAWVSDARYVLLDEPMNALDPVRVDFACGVIEAMKEAGKGVLISSHIMSDIDSLCGSVAFLIDGEFCLEGVTDSRARYLELYKSRDK